MGRECITHGGEEECGNTEGKRLLGRCRYRREDNIKMDRKDMGCSAVDHIYLAQGPVEGSYEHSNVFHKMLGNS
jgi:hypothetical protein